MSLSSEMVVELQPTADPPPESVCIKHSSKEFALVPISDECYKFRKCKYRRRIMDIFEHDTSLRTHLATPSVGFPDTLSGMATTDSNACGHVFTVKMDEYVASTSGHIPSLFVVKLVPYHLKSDGRGKYTNSTDFHTSAEPANIEAKAMLILRQLIMTNVLPNAVLLYKYCVIKNIDILDPGRTNRAFDGLREELHAKPPRIRPQIMCLMSEFVAYGSLRRWAKQRTRSDVEWRCVIFQIMYSLAVLNDAINFRHFDLHMSNVLIDATSRSPTRCYSYSINGQTFHVPCCGFFCKIYDFDWSFAEGGVLTLQNAKVTAGRSSVAPGTHASYDVHRLFNHIFTSVASKLPTETRCFIERVIPEPFRGKDTEFVQNFRLRGSAPPRVPSALRVLNDEYFAPLKAPVRDDSIIRPRFAYDRSRVFSILSHMK